MYSLAFSSGDHMLSGSRTPKSSLYPTSCSPIRTPMDDPQGEDVGIGADREWGLPAGSTGRSPAILPTLPTYQAGGTTARGSVTWVPYA